MNFEFTVLNFIQEHLRTPFLDSVIPAVSALGNGGIIWILFTFILLFSAKTREYGKYTALSLIIMLLICNVTLKPIVARIRPYTVNPSVALLISPPSDYSFPSGHTTAAFASASAYLLCFLKRKRQSEKNAFDNIAIVIFMFVFAVVIAFTRLYLYVHYPTDVVFGAVLGSVIGIFSAKIIEKSA